MYRILTESRVSFMCDNSARVQKWIYLNILFKKYQIYIEENRLNFNIILKNSKNGKLRVWEKKKKTCGRLKQCYIFD